MASPRFLAACATALLARSRPPSPRSRRRTLTMSSWVAPDAPADARRAAAYGPTTSRRRPTAGVKFQMLPKHPSAPPGTFDAVRDGLVDVSYVTASYTPARHPLPLLAELPGAGATAEINSVAFSRIHWKYLQPVERIQGRRSCSACSRTAPGRCSRSSKPVTTVADLAGMKIRSGGGISEAAAQGARRLAVRQAGARVVRAAVAPASPTAPSSRSSRSSPFNLDKVVKYATLFPGGFYSLVVRLLHERGQVEQAVEAGPGRDHCRSRARRWRGSPARPWDAADKSRHGIA